MAESNNSSNLSRQIMGTSDKSIAIQLETIEYYKRIDIAQGKLIEQLEKMRRESVEDKGRIEKEILEKDAELADIKKERDEANDELRELKVKMDDVPVQLRELEDEVERLKEGQKEHEQNAAKLKELESGLGRLEETTNEQKELSGQMKQWLAENSKKVKLLQEKIRDNVELMTRFAKDMEIEYPAESTQHGDAPSLTADNADERG